MFKQWYCAAMSTAMLYGWETWSLHAEDVRRLEVFDYRCLRSIARIGWYDRVSNMQFRNLVLAIDPENILSQRIQLSGPRWLDRMLKMMNNG